MRRPYREIEGNPKMISNGPPVTDQRSVIYWYIAVTGAAISIAALALIVGIPKFVSGPIGDSMGMFFGFMVPSVLIGSFIAGAVAIAFFIIWYRSVARPLGRAKLLVGISLFVISVLIVVGEIVITLVFTALVAFSFLLCCPPPS